MVLVVSGGGDVVHLEAHMNRINCFSHGGDNCNFDLDSL